MFGKKTKRCYRCDREVDPYEWKIHQGYCAKCFEDWQMGKPSPFSIHASEETIPMSQEEYPWGASVALQKDEVPLRWMDGCREFFGDREFSKKLGRKGFLIVTTQRVLFASKMGFFSSNYGVTYAVNLEDIMSTSSGKFGFNDKLVVLDKSGQLKEFVKPFIQSLVAVVNNAMSKRKEALEAQKKRERVQIVLDFTSLKDIMEKGGLIMSSFKCPNCNASLPFPDHGKVLVCKYCNAPIKPIDIFEKIKSLIE